MINLYPIKMWWCAVLSLLVDLLSLHMVRLWNFCNALSLHNWTWSLLHSHILLLYFHSLAILRVMYLLIDTSCYLIECTFLWSLGGWDGLRILAGLDQSSSHGGGVGYGIWLDVGLWNWLDEGVWLSAFGLSECGGDGIFGELGEGNGVHRS